MLVIGWSFHHSNNDHNHIVNSWFQLKEHDDGDNMKLYDKIIMVTTVTIIKIIFKD